MKNGMIYGVLAVLAFKVIARGAWAQDIRPVIRSVKAQYPQTADVPDGLVVAIAKVESNLNPFATGSSGEFGLMQIMPLTFHYIFSINQLGVPDNPYDQFANVLGGMLYLQKLYSVFGSWATVIHAYNVGPGGYDAGNRNWDYFFKVLSWWSVA